MGLLDKFKDKVAGSVENIAIGYFIRGIEAGRYGVGAQNGWFAFKGRKSAIGWSMFAIGSAIAMYPSHETLAMGSFFAVIGSYLGRFGLMAKGADKTPPPFPEELRPAMEFALSAATYITELLTAGGGLMVLSGHESAAGISVTVLVFAQALSTASGYLSTLIGKPPTPQVP